MGLSPREARARYDAVIDFAELREFEELKLKNYSSGMHVRLAFSVAIQVDADILLVDEVLAVGDAAFQQKCFDVFNRMRDDGRTIVFVTHDMGALNRFCHRALLLERGAPVHLGEPHEVADRYLEINFGRDPEAAGAEGARRRRRGARRRGLDRGRARRAPRLAAAGPADHPQGARQLHGRRRGPGGERVRPQRGARRRRSSPRPPASTSAPGTSRAGEEVVFSFTFDNVLAPGRYNPLFTLAHRGTGLDLMDRFEGAFSFVVTGPEAMGGLVDLPVEVGVSRDAAALSAAGGRVSTEAAALRGARSADQGPARADRRLGALLAPHLQHRAQRIQAEVLRLGARLRLAGDAAAAAVRRAVRVLRP